MDKGENKHYVVVGLDEDGDIRVMSVVSNTPEYAKKVFESYIAIATFSKPRQVSVIEGELKIDGRD
jgi:hypothetical protein